MIVGIGTDILSIDRAKAALTRTPAIAKRILTPQELTEYQQHPQPERFFAKRFSAKEAVVKALGTGIGRGVSWQHIRITKNALGRPLVSLTDGALESAEQQGIETIHLSYSDEQESVVAFAVAESA
jgi:holo-[acyl-carrier protein] synthase